MSEKQQKKSSKFGAKALGLVVLLLVAALGYALFLNKTSPKLKPNDTSAQIQKLESKVKSLENIIQNLSANGGTDLKEVAVLNEKIEKTNKANAEILDSKASVSALMGVIERVDRLETNVKNLGQVTSQSALILTAAALTNEAAKTGKPFVYEASVLEELSKGSSVENSAKIIGSFAQKGLPLREDLIEKFIKLYETSFFKTNEPEEKTEEMPSKETADWKDKAISKLKTLVVIEKTNDKEKNILLIDEAYRLVREGDFELAMLKMENNPKYQTEGFEIWKEEVRSEKVFNQEMNKIKALTLSAMKTESLKTNN